MGTGVPPAQPTDIPAAVAAAEHADVVILYIGGKAGWYGDDLTEKEGGDTVDIELPPQQVEVVKAVTDIGKPTVAVVSFARPQGLSAVIDRLPAVINRRTEADIFKGYLDMPSTPLFAFGHGLSYTTFEYGPLQLASDSVDVNRITDVGRDHQHRRSSWHRGRPALRRRHRFRLDTARPAAHRVRPSRPRAGRVEDRRVHRPDDAARVHGKLR
jgi:hypothetical protein